MLRLALIQLNVNAKKSLTLSNTRTLIEEAAKNQANLICLPECFNCPYGINYFKEYSEKADSSETCQLMSSLAKELSIHLIAGSIPEEDEGNYYNTCFVYGPDGSQVAKYRKIHLFDIDVPGGIKFKESEVLSPGNNLTSFSIGPWKIGLGICYDLRFTGLSKAYEKEGCHLLVYPGAFNMTTGPKHWELLIRARSADHQLYTAACSPARDDNAQYVAWAHSTICSPWAEVVAKAGTSEEIVYADLDLEEITKVRRAIPIRDQQRTDVYDS